MMIRTHSTILAMRANCLTQSMLKRKTIFNKIKSNHVGIYFCRRQQAKEDGIRKAILVPMTLARTINELWPTIEQVVDIYYLPTTSDLQVSKLISMLVHQENIVSLLSNNISHPKKNVSLAGKILPCQL